MQEPVDVRKALEAFNIIREQGVKKDAHHQMNGIKVEVGFDGYTVSLYNDYARLDIFFHNKFSFNYTNGKEGEAFLDKLEMIVKKHRLAD